MSLNTLIPIIIIVGMFTKIIISNMILNENRNKSKQQDKAHIL